jgi:hypothetical protein
MKRFLFVLLALSPACYGQDEVPAFAPIVPPKVAWKPILALAGRPSEQTSAAPAPPKIQPQQDSAPVPQATPGPAPAPAAKRLVREYEEPVAAPAPPRRRMVREYEEELPPLPPAQVQQFATQPIQAAMTVPAPATRLVTRPRLYFQTYAIVPVNVAPQQVALQFASPPVTQVVVPAPTVLPSGQFVAASKCNNTFHPIQSVLTGTSNFFATVFGPR